MKAEFPEYREDKSQIVPQGWYVWTRKHPSNIFFHIILVIDPSRDEFTTEAAWDFDGRKPLSLSAMRGNTKQIPAAPVHFRTDILWSPDNFGHWWKLIVRAELYEDDIFYEDPIEDCLPLIEPAVGDAITKLKEFLVPVFGRVVAAHRKKSPSK
jgi:hypothetical protein